MSRLLIILLLAIPLGATAQIYKSVDESGNTVYSDTPPANGSAVENVELGTTNSTPPPPTVNRVPEPVVKQEKTELVVAIISPEEESTIPVGFAGNFSVSASVSPAMRKGEKAQLLMDGVPMGEPQSGLTWSLSNIFRGAHALTVNITGPQGQSLGASPPVTVYVRRASKNF